MLIYFIGSHSTGKSTLAEYISKERGVGLQPEIARQEILKNKIDLNALRRNLNELTNFQVDLLNKQIAVETEQFSKSDNMIFDRCGVDVMAYTIEHTIQAEKIFNNIKIKDYLENFKKQKKVVFFLRPHIDLLENDGIREKVEMTSIYHIDGVIKTLLNISGIDYISINSSNFSERVSTVNTILKHYEL